MQQEFGDYFNQLITESTFILRKTWITKLNAIKKCRSAIKNHRRESALEYLPDSRDDFDYGVVPVVIRYDPEDQEIDEYVPSSSSQNSSIYTESFSDASPDQSD